MSTTSKFRNDIQGLRAIAVLLVVIYHSGMPMFSGGYVGVDVFFVISGFLIAGSLVRELEISGSIEILNFYARRARRLLPAAVLVLISTIVIWRMIYSPLELKQFSSSAIATAAYLSNFWFAHLATDYLADHSNPNPLLHTWSLSVEEQFYLFWPFILLGIHRVLPKRSKSSGLVIGTIAISLASFIGCVLLTSYAQPWAFFICVTRFWEFGVGALCAIYLQKFGEISSPKATLGAIVGLLLVLYSAVSFSATTVFPGYMALFPVIGTALLIGCVSKTQTSYIFSLLANKYCKFLGDISYSLYLWHWPVFVFLDNEGLASQLPWQITGIIVSVILATLTYFLIENPFRFNKLVTAKVARSYQLAILLTGLSLAAGTLVREEAKVGLRDPNQQHFHQIKQTRPKIYAENCHYRLLDVELFDCRYGDTSSDQTIVLFGDSHAAHWFPALEEVALDLKLNLVPFTKSSCPSVLFEPFSPLFGRSYSECSKWRNLVLKRIREINPKAIFISNSYGYLQTDGLDASAWRNHLSELLDALGDNSTKIILAHDVPFLPFDGPTCLARADWHGKNIHKSCKFKRMSTVNSAFMAAEKSAVKSYPNVSTIDITDEICAGDTCNIIDNDVVRYSDSNHLSVAFSRRFAKSIKEALLH